MSTRSPAYRTRQVRQYKLDADQPRYDIATDTEVSTAPVIEYPAHWIKGQLLNVRNNGSTFILTLLEEEFDPREPQKAKFFDNGYDCQQFVSWWYSRDAPDPRAM